MQIDLKHYFYVILLLISFSYQQSCCHSEDRFIAEERTLCLSQLAVHCLRIKSRLFLFHSLWSEDGRTAHPHVPLSNVKGLMVSQAFFPFCHQRLEGRRSMFPSQPWASCPGDSVPCTSSISQCAQGCLGCLSTEYVVLQLFLS